MRILSPYAIQMDDIQVILKWLIFSKRFITLSFIRKSKGWILKLLKWVICYYIIINEFLLILLDYLIKSHHIIIAGENCVRKMSRKLLFIVRHFQWTDPDEHWYACLHFII